MSGLLLFLSIVLSILSDSAYALIVGLLLAGLWLPTLIQRRPRPIQTRRTRSGRFRTAGS